MVRVYGPRSPAAKPALRSGNIRIAQPALQRQRDIRRDSAAPPRPPDMVACDPNTFSRTALVVTGWLHALHNHRHLRLLAKPGSVGYAEHLRSLGTEEFSQITVADAGLVTYTCLVPLPDLTIPLGSLVRVELKRVRVIPQHQYLCRSLEILELR